MQDPSSLTVPQVDWLDAQSAQPQAGPDASAIDLSRSMVRAFWRWRDPQAERVLQMMGDAETWRLDGKPSIDTALMLLATSLARADGASLRQHAEALIEAMAWISAARAVRLLWWLEHRHGLLVEVVEAAASIVSQGKEARLYRPARLLVERLRTLRALNLLARIFSRQRLAEMAEIVGEIAS